MKKVKKGLLIGALAFGMAFTLAACGGGGDSGGSGDSGEKEAAFATSEMNGELTMGEIDGSVYTNESLGLKIEPGADWTENTQFCRDTLIDSMEDITEDTFASDEAFREAVMGGTAMHLVYYKNAVAGQIELTVSGKAADIKKFIESARESTGETLGEDYEMGEPEIIEAAGVEWYGYKLTTEVGGHEVVAGSYVHNYGDCMVTLTVSISDMGDETFDDVMKSFKSI